jgi:hypothetical protein
VSAGLEPRVHHFCVVSITFRRRHVAIRTDVVVHVTACADIDFVASAAAVKANAATPGEILSLGQLQTVEHCSHEAIHTSYSEAFALG